jgi:hypothetical protein
MSSNGRALKDKLVIANGVPVTIALHYLTGQRVQSRIAGAPDQFKFTLTDGREAFFPIEVGEAIRNLNLAGREPFIVCKHGPQHWEVKRASEAPSPVELIPAKNGEARELPSAPPSPEDSIPPFAPIPEVQKPAPAAGSPTKLEQALKTAILAARNAEQYGTELGYVVRFDADAIRAMAITVLINMSEGGRR